MTCLVAYSKHDASRVFVRGIARKAGSPVRCQDSRTLTGSHNMLRRRFIGPFFGVFSVYKCLIVCVLSFTCACFARFVAIGFLQARCSSFGVLALKMFHFQDMTTSKIQVLHVHTRRGSSVKKCQENNRNSKVPCCRSWSGRIGRHGICWSSHGSCCFSVGSSVKRPFLTPWVL